MLSTSPFSPLGLAVDSRTRPLSCLLLFDSSFHLLPSISDHQKKANVIRALIIVHTHPHQRPPTRPLIPRHRLSRMILSLDDRFFHEPIHFFVPSTSTRQTFRIQRMCTFINDLLHEDHASSRHLSPCHFLHLRLFIASIMYMLWTVEVF